MNIKRVAGFGVVLVCCLFANGCFSIEQEIFLNADGSGQVVVFISLPDFPEKMNAVDITQKKNPADALAEFKKELTATLPPTLTLKEAKDVKQNGVQSLYAVFEFKRLDDVQKLLANFGKGSLKEGDIGSDPQWSLRVEKRDNRTFYTQKFMLDVDSKAKAEVKTTSKTGDKEKPEETKESKEMDEALKPLLLSIIRMRFVLHTPTAITDSNADIVLNGHTAVWNCSLAAFAKDKRPIEMKASY